MQPAEYLGAQDLVRRIDMPVLDGPPVSGWEEVYLIAGGKLHQVVIEIAGFLLVVQHTHIASPSFRKREAIVIAGPEPFSPFRNILRDVSFFSRVSSAVTCG